MIPIRYNLRSLTVRKTSNLLAVVGVALVVFVLAAALMLSAGIRKTLASSGSDTTAIVIRVGDAVYSGAGLVVIAIIAILIGLLLPAVQ